MFQIDKYISKKPIVDEAANYMQYSAPVEASSGLDIPQASGLGGSDNLNELALLQKKLAKEALLYEKEMMNLNKNNKVTGSVSPVLNYDEKSTDQYTALNKKYESGGDYNAYNKSGATGVNQFFKSTASPYLKKMGVTWNDFKKNPKIQDSVFQQFTNDNRNILIKNGIKPTNTALYAMHQQGARGGLALLKGGNVSKKNLAANLPKGMAPTRENWLNYWGSRFG